MNSIWINELTWTDISDYLKHDDMVLIPVGSTEQHGPAGPLGVDAYAAIALAEDAAKRTGILSTPPLWFSDAPHHLDFPGTISLRPETLISVIKDIVHSLERNGFRKFVVINGHKGTNIPALTIACRDLQQYELPHVRMALTDPLYLCSNAQELKGGRPEHHAGVLEISHVMYKFPGLVKESERPSQDVTLEDVFGDYISRDLRECARVVEELDERMLQLNEAIQKCIVRDADGEELMDSAADELADRTEQIVYHFKNLKTE